MGPLSLSYQLLIMSFEVGPTSCLEKDEIEPIDLSDHLYMILLLELAKSWILTNQKFFQPLIFFCLPCICAWLARSGAGPPSVYYCYIL